MTTPPTPPAKSGMPKWLIIVLVVVLVIVVGCCGGVTLCSFWAKRGVESVSSQVEKAMKEAQAEAERRGAVAVAKMPANFPSDVPVHSGLTPRFSMSDKTKGEGTVMMAGKVDRAAIVSYFEKEMEKGGWKQEQNVDVGDSTTMSFSKDSRITTVMVMPGDGGETSVNIVYTSK